jgi:hypothetical protein
MKTVEIFGFVAAVALGCKTGLGAGAEATAVARDASVDTFPYFKCQVSILDPETLQYDVRSSGVLHNGDLEPLTVKMSGDLSFELSAYETQLNVILNRSGQDVVLFESTLYSSHTPFAPGMRQSLRFSLGANAIPGLANTTQVQCEALGEQPNL